MTPARVAALIEMARQDVSPHERDIARAKLQEAGMGWDEPPTRPPAAPAPAFDPGWQHVQVTFTGTGTTNVSFNGFSIRFNHRQG